MQYGCAQMYRRVPAHGLMHQHKLLGTWAHRHLNPYRGAECLSSGPQAAQNEGLDTLGH